MKQQSVASNSAINLIVLRCENLERSRAFYEALGLELRPEKHGTGPDHYSCALGEMVLELYPASGGATTAGLRLGFRIPDVRATEATLRSVALGEVVKFVEPAMAIVRDPDGHTLELHQA